MKCTSCGADFTGAFCPYCGAKAPEAAPSAPVQNNNISAGIQPQPPFSPSPAAPVQNSTFVSAQHSKPVSENAYSRPAAPVGGAYQPATAGGEMFKQPKKKSKAPLIIGIVVAVIAVIGILGLCFAQSIIRSITGETAYYLLQETETVKDLLDLDLKKLQKNDKLSSSTTIDVKGDGEYSKEIQKVLSQVTVNTAIDQKDGKMMLDAKGDFSGKNAELKVCADENGLGITAPGLADGAFYYELSSAILKADNDELDEIVSELASIIKEVEDEELDGAITIENEEVNGKKCRVVTYTFTKKTAALALASLMEKAMNNEKLMKSLESYIKTYYERSYGQYQENPYYTPPTYEEFLQQFKDYPKQLREFVKESKDDSKLYFSIAYKGSRILQRKIEADGEKLIIDTDTSGSEKTLNVTLSGGKSEQEIVSYTKTKDSADLVVKGNSETIFTLSINNYEVKKINGIYVPVFSMKVDIVEDNTTLTLDAEDNDTYDLIAHLNLAGKDEYTFTLTNELSSKPDFSSFEEPDKNASTDYNSFMNKVTNELNNVLEDAMDD